MIESFRFPAQWQKLGFTSPFMKKEEIEENIGTLYTFLYSNIPEGLNVEFPIFNENDIPIRIRELHNMDDDEVFFLPGRKIMEEPEVEFQIPGGEEEEQIFIE